MKRASAGKKLLSFLLSLSFVGTMAASAAAATQAPGTEQNPQVHAAEAFNPNHTVVIPTKWIDADWSSQNTAAKTAEVVTVQNTYLNIAIKGGDNAGNRASVSSAGLGKVKNGSMSATFIVPKEIDKDNIRFGIQVRYNSQSDLVWIACDQQGWYLQRKGGGGNKATNRVRPDLLPNPGDTVRIDATFIDEKISMSVNGTELFKDDTSIYQGTSAPAAGDAGFMISGVMKNTTLQATNISFTSMDAGVDTTSYDWTKDTWKDSNNNYTASSLTTVEEGGYFDFETDDTNAGWKNAAVYTTNKVGTDGTMKDGRIEATIVPKADLAAGPSFAFVFRYKDMNNAAWFGYDKDGWYWQTFANGAENYSAISGRLPAPTANKAAKVVIEVQGNKLWAAVDGQIAFDGVEVPGLDTLEAGKAGFLGQRTQHTFIEAYTAMSYDVNAPDDPNTDKADLTTLSTDAMTVTIDKSFPRVVKYEMGGDTMYGQPLVLDTLEIAADGYTPPKEDRDNGITGILVKPTVSCTVQGATATYTMTVKDAQANLDVVITATLKAENNTVSFDIIKVENKIPGSKINTIHIPNFSLVSVRNNEENAEFSGAVLYNSVGGTGDSTIEVNRKFNPSSADYKNAGYMYGFVSNSKFSAGVWSNSENASDQRVMRSSQVAKDEAGNSFSYIGLGSGMWTYWNQDMPAPQVEFPSANLEALPSMKVAIAHGDQNDDGVMNWQDGAIVYRSIMNNPYKSEQVPELVSQRVVENMSSQASHPFLESLDGIKRVSLATDGLGQMVLLKGYANEGHDSAHPDFGDIGKRIGGPEDMVSLLEKSVEYGARVGVHINASEIYPEAKCFSDNIISSRNQFGWNWLDESYSMNHIYDLASGERAQRLDALYNKLGGASNLLDFIYLDVWLAPTWHTRQVSNQFIERGWRVANEWGAANEYNATWTHWATDISYNNAADNGINSQIARFLRNHQKDVWIANEPAQGGAATGPLLGGMDVVGFEGWQREKSFDAHIAATFGPNVPTKFLQHYQITNWENDPSVDSQLMNAEKEIRLERVNSDGTTDKVVVTRNSDNRGRTITFNGKVVLTGSAIATTAAGVSGTDEVYLLPWNWDSDGKELPADEQKLYHYNPKGGATTWDLPNGWDNAKVYSLSDAGKTAANIASISGSQITLNAEAGVPYVLYKAEPSAVNPTFEDMKWGDGTHIVDPSFTSQTLKAWTVTGTGVEIVKSSTGNNPVLNIANTSGEASVSQTITGLTGGQRYAVLVGIDNQSETAKAYLEVTTSEGTFSNYSGRSFVQNAVGPSSYHSTTMQNVYVFFTMPEGQTTAKLTLRREAGAGYAQFDELRVVATKQDNQISDKTFKQDFENNVQGIYPFVPTFYKGWAADIEIHLSERNGPYTQQGWRNSYYKRMIDDVISGDWSLKIHQRINTNCPVVQTIPENYRFKPNTTYTVSFDYEAGCDNAYAFAIGVGAYAYPNGGTPENMQKENLASTATPLDSEERGVPKRYTKTFTTGDTEETWIAIFSNPGTPKIEDSMTKNPVEGTMWKLGYASIVLDNLTITEGTVEEPDDRTELGEVIAEAEKLSASDYTAESWTALKNAIDASKALADDATNEQVRRAADDIEIAMDNLKKATPRTALDEAIAAAEKLTASDYTAESWKALQDAVNAGKALADDATAEQIAAAAKAINDAIAALVEAPIPPVDRTALNEAIAAAEKLTASDYTAESWKTLQDAVNAGKALADDATAEQVAAAAKAINDAIAALVEVTAPPVDRTALNEAIAAAEKLNASDYTTESWTALKNAVDAGKALADDATAEQVAAAAKAINDAIAALVEVTAPPVDRTALDEAIAAAEKLTASDYTEESWAALQEAVAAGKALGGDATAEQIAAAAKAINDAIAALVEAPIPPVDRTALNEAIAAAEALNAGNYTTESWEALQIAVAVGKNLPEEATAEQVAAAAKAINDAIAALVEVTAPPVDRTALDEAIAKAEALTASDYTAESWAALQKALTAGKKLGGDATAEQIAAAAKAINDAIAALEKAPAPPVDRTALDEAIAKAEALSASDYTTESWSKLQAAVAAGKALADDATAEQIIDAAKAINDAIAALVEVTAPPVDRSVLDDAIAAAEKLTESDYTAESWAALQEAVAAGKALGGDATAEQIAAAAKAINDAITNLKKNEPVDTEKTIVDEKTGISITGKLPDNAELKVELITSGANLELAQNALTGIEGSFMLWDIQYLVNGTVTQPDGTITLSLPIPEGYDPAKVELYRIEEDGTKTLIESTVKDGKLVATLDHLSLYALVHNEAKGNNSSSSSSGSEGSSSSSSSGSNGGGTTPSTGDAPILPLVVLLAGSGAAALVLKNRKNRTEI